MLPRELIHRILRHNVVPSARHFSSSLRRANVVKELEERGMVAELTSRALRDHVEKPTTVYLGVDPSARSLHVGNLAALIGLLHFRLHGHDAIAMIGEATGSIGDPSGRSTERNALSSEELQKNVEAITEQLRTFLDRGVPFALSRTRRRDATGGEEQAAGNIRVENNINWLGGMGLLDFLRTAGKTARVSTMLSRESVKSRLESSSGISFTEFSYQLLQAYDFHTLHQRHGCTIQLGGSDQLGNIMSGIEMIRKIDAPATSSVDGEPEPDVHPAYGLTMPLLTTASGEKFGKSAGNAVWLDPSMTSPFEFYQFFLRTTDEELLKYLKIFTFVRVIETEYIMADHKANPEHRVAQKVLAAEATELIHGAAGLRQALAATDLFFGSDLKTLDIPTLTKSLDAVSESDSPSGIPSILVRLPKTYFVGQSLEKIVTGSGLLASKTQARKAIEAGGVSLNGVKVPAQSHQRTISEEDLLEGGLIVLRAGKQAYKAVLLE